MAKRSKEISTIDVDLLSKYYYYHVWKERLDWTKHNIPVKVKDPRTGFFLEAYLEAPPNITDIITQTTSVDIAYMFLYVDRVIEVPLTDIYVSSRTFKMLDSADTIMDKIPGLEQSSTEELLNQTSFIPVEKFTIKDIDKLFDFYKHSFTIDEIKSCLNVNVTEQDLSLYRKTGKRNCLITSKLCDTYASNIPALTNKINMANTFNTLPSLINIYKDCTQCVLGQKRVSRFAHVSPIISVTYPRLGKINIDQVTSIPKDTICFIGEAPGIKEEQDNITFHPKAPAGEVLYKVITAAGLPYDLCYFTNAVLCRPESSNSSSTQNGTPTTSDIKSCNTRLKNELAILKPKIVVLLGKSAYYSFFGKEPKSVKEMTGWLDDNKTVYLVPHPSYIVRELSFASDSSIVSIKRDYLDHFNKIKEQYKP